MTMSYPGWRRSLFPVAISMLGLLIFLMDLALPQGIVVFMLYTPCLILTAYHKNCRFTFALGTVFSVMTVIGYLLSDNIVLPLWLPPLNRTVGVLMVWISVFLVRAHIRATEQIAELQNLLTICAWTKQVRIDGKWITIEDFLTKYFNLKLTHGITPEMAKQMAEEAQIYLAQRQS